MKSTLFLFRLLALSLVWYALGSCSTEMAVQQTLGASKEAPVFLACKAVSDREITFQFSLPVRVVSLRFDPPMEVAATSEGETVAVTLANPLAGGEPITADILVEDEGGNTLNVLVPFRSRNDQMPSLVITEVRTEYSKPKVEFVELRALSAGNLGGLRMYINTPDAPFYEFPPALVAAGEYLVIHLRSLDPESVDETTADLAASPYTKDNEAQIDARDFWIPGAVKHLNKRAGAVFLTDQDDRILDAILFSEAPDPWWKDDALAQAAELLEGQGAWSGPAGGIPGPAEAVSSRDTTATRTICRDESLPDSHGAGDWYITAASNATPGKPNSTRRYVPKE
jgi:hypothetical protein